jgi:tetratricopeptide (TPR) repeat protein
MQTSNLVGVLFILKIDPSISATPFANVENVGYYPGEKEILFSMHSVFRIGQVKQIDENDRLWQVDLILTGDNDPQLHALTESMREETKGPTGWFRLGKLMIKVGQFNKAEELYDILLKQTTNDREKSHLVQQIGQIKYYQGKYEEAIGFYEKALEIFQKTLPANHPSLATSYNNIGAVYDDMGEYSKALSSHEKALSSIKKLFLQIILIWLLLTTTSEGCITTWASTRKHFHTMKKHLKSLKKLFLQIILIWLLLTTTSEGCMTTWASTRKHFHIMKKHLKSFKKLFL